MAYIEQLIADLAPAIDAGTARFSRATAQALALQECSLLPKLRADGGAFLEPMLFAHLSDKAPEWPIEQWLIGHIGEGSGALDVGVHSDAQGRVYLPRIGTLLTQVPQVRFRLSMDPASRRLALRHAGRPVAFTLLPALFAGPDGIELCRHGHPLLERFFVNREGVPVPVEIESAVQTHREHLEAALTTVARHCPLYAVNISRCVRRLVVFCAPNVNSFASIGAHGAAFINAAADDDEIHFIEELAHQCGHVVFSAATFDNDLLFNTSPHAPMRTLTGRTDDSRSLYVVLHGVFTEIAIISCLESLLVEHGRPLRQRHELQGRIAFIISRLAADLSNLAHPEIFSPSGVALYRKFLDIFGQAHAKQRHLVQRADFSNQTYNFSYRRYAELNPQLDAGRRPPRRRSRQSLELDDLRPLGFGAYRVRLAAPHAQALAHALSQGCNLIDTAATYGDGESEALIGRVLNERPECQAFVVTKAGYLRGDAAGRIAQLGLPREAVVQASADSMHCIHPDFLRSQMQASCARLGVDRLDGFLLHNPEYQFGDGKSEAALRAGRASIAKAFEFLEDCAREGKIGYYGVSSNALAGVVGGADAIKLDELLLVAQHVASDHHFRLVQFPFNLLERGAAQAQQGGESLISLAKRHGLVTFANRPLNALRDGKAVRLADGRSHPVRSEEEAEQAWSACKNWVAQRMRALGVDGQPEDFEIIAVLDRRWREFDTAEAAAYVFETHLYPLLQRFAGGPMNDGDNEPFMRFYDGVLARVQGHAALQAAAVRREAVEEGFIADDRRPLALAACESYLRTGIDHVLVGMRKSEYVDELRPLFGLSHSRSRSARRSRNGPGESLDRGDAA